MDLHYIVHPGIRDTIGLDIQGNPASFGAAIGVRIQDAAREGNPVPVSRDQKAAEAHSGAERLAFMVYIPDDGLMEFADPSRSYGFEVKTSVKSTRRLGFDGGVTKVLNAYYKGTNPRVYVDRAPRFVANAALTLLGRKGWSGSL